MTTENDVNPQAARVTGKFIMVRHGESEGNRERRFTVSSEVPLTELGRLQAEAAARRIAQSFKPQLVVSSRFRRARQTSEIIAERLKLPIEVVPDLHERDLGTLKGHSYDDLREFARNDPSYNPAQGWLWRPAGGESYEDVRRRALSAIDILLKKYHDKEIVIVSHGGVILALWAHIAGAWPGAHLPPNCGIVLIEHNGHLMYQPKIVQGKESRELG